ncbi:FAD/NAD(P)-binding domain-containing protein [Calocera viscosa TUFC12733]|uniref:FAD/NAD(P)-binding domain-containing protein n=1 Tax=Calocera viscosa (strain TUFC12733) TaxID=1330018 RepID=A0A167K6E3_CALVF|nr:FAD/NAD(P)-binding domain-containing protein [Calocera viscosa TUFC12733]
MGDLPTGTPLRIAILGGGIVGLSLAVALHMRGAPFTLYESAQRFSEIGAGIMMGQNALNVLRTLGLAEEYEQLARSSWREGGETGVFFQFRFGDGRDDGEPVGQLKMPSGKMSTHRAELLELLLRHVPPERVRFQKQLVGYAQLPGEALQLSFSDGTSQECDVLLGADGIKSTVRRLMYAGKESRQEPRWSGSYAYRALVPTDKVLAAVGQTITSTPIMWLERGRHLVNYLVAGGKYLNVVAIKTDYTQGRYPKWENHEWVEHNVDERELLSDFEGCGPQVKKIIDLVERPSRWALFDLPDLPYFVQGNVALIGDAAHAMMPHQGNGASQGIEDAHVLAHLLSHPKVTPDTVSSALKAYELVRKDRVQHIKELAYETGKLWELSTPVGDDVGMFAKAAGHNMDWVWGVDIDKQVQTAVSWFEMSLA